MSTLKDLNATLFDQLNRLANCDKKDLETEVQRANSIESISEQIIKSHNTQLQAVELVAKYRGLNANQETPLLNVSGVEV